MLIARSLYAMLLLFPRSVDAADIAVVPSDPATWSSEFLRRSQPTEECPGGTVEQAEKHMTVSEAYSPERFEAIYPSLLRSLKGIEGTDRFHSFYLKSDLPGGRFWGQGGYLVVRGTCIIHVNVTIYDN